MTRMAILYILRHNPWGIGGGCYACRCYFDAFMEVFEGANIDVCICEEYLNGNENGLPFTVDGLPNKDKNKNENKKNGNGNVDFIRVEQRSKIEKVMSPITGLLHRFDCTARELLKSKKYDYCIFDHSSIAGPLIGLCRKLGVKTIVINHNCEAEYYRDNYDILHRMLFLRHVKRAEKLSYQGCDYNIFLTEEDCTLFRQMYGPSQTYSIVTGCFEFKRNNNNNDNGNVNLNEKERLRFVISGTIGNVQNMDGIQYFLDDLLEYVPKDAEVVITGKNPPDSLHCEIEKLNQTGKYAQLTLIPNPADIKSIVNGCDVFLCPTRSGGGLKLRVMDGLIAGLPVIAHKVSARGYSEFAKQGYLWPFDSKESFSNALCDIIRRINNNQLNRKNIQDYSEERFSFENKAKMLKSIFRN